MGRHRIKLLLALVSFAVLCSTQGFACNCGKGATPCDFDKGHDGSQTVFIGVAVSTATVSDVVEQGGHARRATVEKVTFHVEEAFENTPTGKFADVYGRGTTCDLRSFFTAGTQYVVYGFRDKNGKIRNDRCTRTAKGRNGAIALRVQNRAKSSTTSVVTDYYSQAAPSCGA